jgi:hypothetical protein
MTTTVIHRSPDPFAPDIELSLTRHLVRRCYEPCKPVQEHRDLWTATNHAIDARNHLHSLFRDGHAIVSTPGRGNVHGSVDWTNEGPGTYTVAGIPVHGFRGPYRNGCYVFTREAP